MLQNSDDVGKLIEQQSLEYSAVDILDNSNNTSPPASPVGANLSPILPAETAPSPIRPANGSPLPSPVLPFLRDQQKEEYEEKGAILLMLVPFLNLLHPAIKRIMPFILFYLLC